MNGLFSCNYASSAPSTFFLYGLMLSVAGIVAVLFFQAHRYMLQDAARPPMSAVKFVVYSLLWTVLCAVVAGILARAAATGYLPMSVCMLHARFAPVLFVSPPLLMLVYLGWYHNVRLPALRAKSCA